MRVCADDGAAFAGLRDWRTVRKWRQRAWPEIWKRCDTLILGAGEGASAGESECGRRQGLKVLAFVVLAQAEGGEAGANASAVRYLHLERVRCARLSREDCVYAENGQAKRVLRKIRVHWRGRAQANDQRSTTAVCDCVCFVLAIASLHA